MINKNYCMSHYLAFRFIKNENINFFENLSHKVYKPKPENELLPVKNIDDIECIIKEKIKKFYVPNKTAILLSGGIDSAILASYLPKDTIAYTFKCIADGAIDETEAAKKYCDTYGLKQEIIEMHWSDFEELTPEILEYDGVPFHSIEVQLVKAAKYAKSQGINRLIIGESADLIFGGMDKLLSKDWDFNDFVERYNFINPEDILKEYINIPIYAYIPFAILVILATTNAVNLTDGIDGLSSSVCTIIITCLTIIATTLGVKEIVIFGAIVIGAVLGFLMFNIHPAKVFMGDTGSLFLGGVISGIALYLKMPLILLLIALIPVIETLSVIIQVTYFKKTGKRVFKMAPIHHHLELSGWRENQVVMLFSVITLIVCVVGLKIV